MGRCGQVVCAQLGADKLAATLIRAARRVAKKVMGTPWRQTKKKTKNQVIELARWMLLIMEDISK
jgi:hypothetical protein